MSKFFQTVTEILGWLQIVASPFLIALIVAALLYFSSPTTERLVIAVIIAIVGLFTGIFWATRVWKKGGTIKFLSRIHATPELDNDEKKE
jgi:uncharacterized membrane protein HdeD (DUF308 family)